MVTTVEIIGNFDRQDGSSAVTGTLYFTLSQRDFDGPTLIEPVQQAVPLDGEGSFAGVRLWPNDRGRMNSTYRVEYLPGGASNREVIDKALFVPESGGPHDLSDLLTASAVARKSGLDRIVPISAEDFATRMDAGTLADALYLVEGAEA